MIPLELETIADIVDGRLADVPDPHAVVSGSVEIDSRLVGPGGLFVALAGERHDGHDFAAQAIADGATAVLAQRPVGVPAVVVPDVQTALGRLARGVLDQLDDITVVSLTGSAGKTSTKDLIAVLLGSLGPTVAPPGSFNNELGHPYTVLRADADTRYLVLECGARGLGHIAELCQIAPPDIGAVLNVGTAHVGEFGSPEITAQAKGELVEAVPAAADGGVAVLNAADHRVAAMAARTKGRVMWFGEAASDRAPGEAPLAVAAEDLVLDEQGRATFGLLAAGELHPVRLKLHGEHMASNALAAATVALAAGMPPADIATVLSRAELASRWRMEVDRRADGLVVINDAYNANPESVRAALKSLATIGRGRRTWAVLGQMAELGDQSAQAHDEMGRLAVRLDVSRLVVVGREAAPMHYGASLEGSWSEESVLVEDAQAATALLLDQVGPEDVVLVKGSRVAGLEKVAQALLEVPVLPAVGTPEAVLQQEAYLAEDDE